jgi:excinuclease ABC subunit B
VEILRGLRLADFDVLVGINLLREGLDLPEVSLVAILDADKEGFLRSERSLIQTAGRAARNAGGRVIFYADQLTDSMRRAIAEMNRRRERQRSWNTQHGITPRTILKTRDEILQATSVADAIGRAEQARAEEAVLLGDDPERLLAQLEGEMLEAARALEFERAASLRDRIDDVRAMLAGVASGESAGRPSDRPRGVRPGREPRKRAHRFGKDR